MDDLPEVRLPPGLEVRPVTRDDYRAIWEADAEAFRDHWGEIDESEEAFLRFVDDPVYDPELFVIAFDGDEIAGLVLNVIDPADVERKGEVRGLLDSVAVRRPWRRRGLARALIAHSLRLLRDRGATSAFLGVDGENPNRAMTLYESCGFRIASSGTTWRKPLHPETLTR
jgi:ribosomal protein S18 acetylase RimI-like enzyme